MGRRVFFSEEKKQKTFGRCRGLPGGTRDSSKSFLVLFFKKEPLPSLSLALNSANFRLEDPALRTGKAPARFMPQRWLPLHRSMLESDMHENASAHRYFPSLTLRIAHDDYAREAGAENAPADARGEYTCLMIAICNWPCSPS
jgi:hypothetical protein